MDTGFVKQFDYAKLPFCLISAMLIYRQQQA